MCAAGAGVAHEWARARTLASTRPAEKSTARAEREHRQRGRTNGNKGTWWPAGGLMVAEMRLYVAKKCKKACRIQGNFVPSPHLLRG